VAVCGRANRIRAHHGQLASRPYEPGEARGKARRASGGQHIRESVAVRAVLRTSRPTRGRSTEDRARLHDVGADLLFLPDEEAIYPFGWANMTRVTVPGLTDVLCGAARPGHFDGVTSVVCRLLNIVQPDAVVFGEKDYQQLLVIRRMVSDLHLPVRIVAGPTQREPDGLALSSRNQYLSADERAAAPVIFAALKRSAERLRAGDRRYRVLERAGRAMIGRRGLRPEYFAIRAASDLAPPRPDTKAVVILAAARCGRARLIDNLSVNI
jgi:pantoate--beta-alanine ligase